MFGAKFLQWTLKLYRLMKKHGPVLLLPAVMISPYTAPLAPFAVCAQLLYGLLKGQKAGLKDSMLFYPYSFLAASSFLGAIFHRDYRSLLATLYILLPYLLFGLTLDTRLTAKNSLKLLKFLVFFSFPLGLFGLYQKIALPMDQGRVMATFSNVNYYAYYLETVLLLSVGLYPSLEKGERSFLFIVTAFNVLNLFFSGSRTALIAVVIGYLVYLSIGRRYRCLLYSLFLAAFASVLLIKYNSCFPRVETLYRDLIERLELWVWTVSALGSNPWIGRGFLSFRQYAYRQSYSLSHSHNLFLNIWFEFGFLGLLVLPLLLAFIIRSLRKMTSSPYRELMHSLASVFITTLIHGLVDIPFVGVQTSLIFLMLLSIYLTIYRETC